MKRLLVYLKDYKKECVLGPLFKLLEASFELIVPLIIASIIDRGIGRGDKHYVLQMCGVLILLGIVGLIAAVTAQYFAAKAAVGFATKLKKALFKHIQGLSYAEIDALGTSTMITRMTSDVNQVQSGVNLVLRLLLRSPFVVFGAMAMAFTQDIKAALTFVGAIAFLSVVIFGIMLINIPMYKKVQAGLDKVLLTTRENLTGVRVIRAFCKEEDEIRKFRERNEKLTHDQKHVGKIAALLNPLTYVIINIFIVLLIYVGAIRVDAGVITQGTVVALYNYMSQILVELIKLANLIVNVTKSIACGNRISAVFDIESSIRYGTVSEGTDTDETIRFEHVSMSYEKAGEALSDVTFLAKSGETIGIIGGTGSGKSTLVNLIPRFYDATRGDVYIKGVNVKELTAKAIESAVAVVPQKAVLFSGTVRDNMKWGKEDATDDEIYEALEIAQAKEIVDGKGEGLDYLISQSGKNLSGGQRQRLTIARALVKKSDIVILDDSSSALDYATDAKLRGALKKMKNKPTVVIVSQRTSSISHADKIIVLDDGNVVGMGRHEELLKSCPVYAEIHNSQFGKGGVSHE